MCLTEAEAKRERGTIEAFIECLEGAAPSCSNLSLRTRDGEHCDQFWPNFGNLAKNLNYSVIFRGFIQFFGKHFNLIWQKSLIIRLHFAVLFSFGQF